MGFQRNVQGFLSSLMSLLQPTEIDPYLKTQVEGHRFFSCGDSSVSLGPFLDEQLRSPSLSEHIMVTDLIIMKEKAGVQHEYLGVKVAAIDDSDRVIDSACVRIDRIPNASKVKGYHLGDVDDNSSPTPPSLPHNDPPSTSPSLPTDDPPAMSSLSLQALALEVADSAKSTPSVHLEAPAAQDIATAAQGSSSSSLPSWNDITLYSRRRLSTGPASDCIRYSHGTSIHLSATSVIMSTVSFKTRGLSFNELVVLAHAVSKAGSDYNISGTMCYWFTGSIWDVVVVEKEGSIKSITKGNSRWMQQGTPHGLPMVLLPTGVLLPSQEPPALRVAYKKDWEEFKEKMCKAKKVILLLLTWRDLDLNLCFLGS